MAEVAESVSLDSEAGSESEDASSGSRGSRAELVADSHCEQTQCADSRDRSDDTIHTLMARLAPSIRQHVEEALLPLVSALRSREENEQKHRKKLLGLETEKLTLERKRLMFKQRRAAAAAAPPPCPGPNKNSLKSNRHKVVAKKNPPRAAEQDQTIVIVGTECGCLREKNASGGGETQISILRKAEFESKIMTRQSQKHDYRGSDGKSELQGTKKLRQL